MLLAHRIELVPNKSQISYLINCCGCARFAYNWALTEWKNYWAEQQILAVRNMLMPSFTGLYVIARRPKLMTNDEWRPVAQTIIDALRRKGPVNYPVTKTGADI